jgi:hypothetical protein
MATEALEETVVGGKGRVEALDGAAARATRQLQGYDGWQGE